MPPTTRLGDTEIVRIGLGTNRLRDTAANRSFVAAAVEAGVNFIDTAHLYAGGESEQAIGAALGPFADDLVVGTKGAFLPGGGAEGLRAELETSFERLGVETIPLYYQHRTHDDLPAERAMELLKEYRDAGRIAHIGLSEVTISEIERAREVAPISAVQNEYHLGERMHDEVIDYCTEEEIVFVPFFPLHGGDSPALAEIAARHAATSSQIKLAWLLARSPVVVPIPGTLSVEHVRENLAALDVELAGAELEAIASG